MLDTVQKRGTAKKPWLDSYPKGVPAEVDVRAFASLKDMFEQSCARFRDTAGVRQHGRGPDLSTRSTGSPAISPPTCSTVIGLPGRARRDHAAQPAAVPGRAVRARCAPA